MKMKFLTVALGMAFSATAFNASAQKAYKEGVITMNMTAMGQAIEAKAYFRTDSSAVAFNAGPADIKVLSDNKGSFMAILVDVPVASMKKAAISTPAEIEEQRSKFPKFTFKPTTETKVINGFNCTKVTATDTKDNKNYDIWVTKDISLPETSAAKIYAGAGGVPIQYTTFQNGQASEVTIKSIVEQKVPAGTFSIPADFEKITMEDLKSLGGGN